MRLEALARNPTEFRHSAPSAPTGVRPVDSLAGRLTVHDLVDPPRRDTDIHGELVLCDAESLDDVLHHDFARVNRRVELLSHDAPEW